MEWKSAELLEDEGVKVPGSWLKLHYYEAFSILFRFENVLRIFVYTVLKVKIGREWAKTSVDLNGKTVGSILSLAGQRISQEQDMGYLGYHIHSPIMQLTAGELVSIIFSDSNWVQFKDYFPGKKDIIKHKILEILEVRNALAHFRPIKPEDIQVVKQNIGQTLARVETYLSDMTDVTTKVPSNNQSAWYGRSLQLTSKNVKVNSFFSSTESWAKISIRFTSPTIYKRASKDSVWFKPLTLMTNQILKDFKEIYQDAIYVTETSSLRVDEEDDQPFASKSVHLIFSCGTLESNLTIFDGLATLLAAIDTETELIEQETTAQGRYVRSSDARARKRGDWWQIELGSLECEVSTEDPVEYWGDISLRAGIISDVVKYPWMPVSIAKDDFSLF
jgi:hypothetical protein